MNWVVSVNLGPTFSRRKKLICTWRYHDKSEFRKCPVKLSTRETLIFPLFLFCSFFFISLKIEKGALLNIEGDIPFRHRFKNEVGCGLGIKIENWWDAFAAQTKRIFNNLIIHIPVFPKTSFRAVVLDVCNHKKYLGINIHKYLLVARNCTVC